MIDKWRAFANVIASNGTGELHRILLHGPPGTSKTTMSCLNSPNGFYMVTLHEESTVADLLGMWIPKGNEFIWQEGFGIKAMKEGKSLILNEICDASASVMTVLYGLLDDLSVAVINAPNGDVIKPTKGYKVLATMNGKPEDLPDALSDRFDVKLFVERPHPDAIASLPPDLQRVASNAYSNPDDLQITMRDVIAFSKLRHVLPTDEALELCFGPWWSDVNTILKMDAADAPTV